MKFCKERGRGREGGKRKEKTIINILNSQTRKGKVKQSQDLTKEKRENMMQLQMQYDRLDEEAAPPTNKVIIN